MVETAYTHWFENLRANPSVSVELGAETFEATATVATGEELERLWDWMNQSWPWLAEHQQTASLQIPLVVLQRWPVRLSD